MTDKDSKDAADNAAPVPAPEISSGAGAVVPAGQAGTGGRTGGPGKENAGDQAGDIPAVEIGGRGGADPARYGDWEINGRCVDF
ncbi:MAG: DUF1674 domain-containing protein [Rhodospirillaceae bacterium]